MKNNQPITDKSSNNAHADLLLEIEQTPEEYLPELVQIVRLFRQTVTMKQAALNDWEQAINEISYSDAMKKQQKKENIKKLFDSWNDLDDQKEQEETLEIIESLKGISMTYVADYAPSGELNVFYYLEGEDFYEYPDEEDLKNSGSYV